MHLALFFLWKRLFLRKASLHCSTVVNLYFHRRMNPVMKPQSAPGPENTQLLPHLLKSLSMVWFIVLSQCISRPECLVTVVAGKRDSLQVVRLYVVLDVTPLSLLATHSAGVSLLQSTFAHVFTFPHHGLDLFIQFLYISDINTCKLKVWNSHCCLTAHNGR